MGVLDALSFIYIGFPTVIDRFIQQVITQQLTNTLDSLTMVPLDAEYKNQ